MRTWLRFGPITLRIARRGVETKTKVGPYRWVVDRALARLAGYRRLTLRYERSAQLFTAFRTLAAMLTYYKKVTMWDKI
jgi:transposase